MAMSKKDFIALADAIKEYNERAKRPGAGTPWRTEFSEYQLNMLADFCKQQNGRFMQERWLGYIKGTCGKNGGNIK